MGYSNRSWVQGGPGYADYSVPNATQATDGAMSKEDKQKLDDLDSSAPTIPATTKLIADGVAKSLITVDMSATGDNSWAGMLFFAVEAADGTNVQIRSGNVIVSVARASNGTYATAATSRDAASNTAGNVTAVFAWITSGTTATLQVTCTSTLVPTDFHVTFYLPYATHPDAVAVAP